MLLIASTAVTNNKMSNTFFKSFKTDVAMVILHFKPSRGLYDSKMLDLSDIFFFFYLIHLFSIKFLIFLFARLR